MKTVLTAIFLLLCAGMSLHTTILYKESERLLKAKHEADVQNARKQGYEDGLARTSILLRYEGKTYRVPAPWLGSPRFQDSGLISTRDYPPAPAYEEVKK